MLQIFTFNNSYCSGGSFGGSFDLWGILGVYDTAWLVNFCLPFSIVFLKMTAWVELQYNAGAWCTEILSAINQKYSSELEAAIQKFLQDTEVNTKESKLEMLDIVVDFLDSDMWHHHRVQCSSQTEVCVHCKYYVTLYSCHLTILLCSFHFPLLHFRMLYCASLGMMIWLLFRKLCLRMSCPI